jgi:ABC-type multidrug transport system fused ATPase/permease subunit
LATADSTPISDLSNAALTRRMLGLAWRYRWGCVQILSLQACLLLLNVAALTLLGVAIDVIRHAAVADSPEPIYPLGLVPPAEWSAQRLALTAAAAMLLVGLVRGIVNYFLAVTVVRIVQQQIVVTLRAEVYDKLQRLGFRFFDRHTSGSIINRVTGDVQSVRLFVDGVIIPMVIVLLTLGFYLAYMLRLHVGLTLACLSTLPIMWGLSGRFSRMVRPAYERNRELVDKLVLTLTENIRGVHVVKGFGREPEEMAKFGRAGDAVLEQQHWIYERVSRFTPTIEMLSGITTAVLLGYGGLLVMRRELPLGSGLLVFSGLLQQFASQVARVTNIVNSVQQSLTGARRVFEILDAPIDVRSPENPVRKPRLRGEITFENVSFAYDSEKPVLQQVSFTVRPGQCVAIVGATGAGKTTLLSLIPRFYDVAAGCVKLDGIDVRRYDLDDLRRNIGVVFQESFLFSDTVAANIAFGRPDADAAQIRKAASIAAADEFIVANPAGYDARLIESGANLSGGQRQRLAIARAVLLEPPILLLDDPTASVDPHTEHEILDAMDRAMAGRTTIVVAHRLSTLRRADLILVLEEGRIIEAGTHAELLERAGPYRAAARIQTDWSDVDPLSQAG